MDLGHQLTDEELAKLERKIAKVYKTAADEMQDKITEYFKKFDEQDKKKRELLEQGKITEQEYKQWRLGKLATGKKYQSMRDQLAERMTNANQEAVAYVNSSTPTVYSLNRNYTAYQIEQADINASFQLWDESTVARLIKDNPELMPNYPKEKALARGIDLDWGKKQISKEITTGILLGESNQRIAKRLLTELPNMNKASAIRTARTATTSAENGGRLDTFKQAEQMGIPIKKQWRATHDGRTREEHILADGQIVGVDEPFIVGGEELMKPGDDSGSGWNIYNCFSGDIKVASDSKAIRSYKHKYKGDLVRIKTATGIEFSCTPNHPILTPNGWVSANMFNNGDDILIASIGDNMLFGRNPDVEHIFPSFSAFHKSIKMFRGQRTIALGVNFHGDVATTDVEIIAQKRFLTNNGDTSRFKRLRELIFKHTYIALTRKSALMEHFGRICKSSFGLISLKRVLLSFIRSHICHSDIHRFRTPTNMNISLTEYPIDNIPAETEIRSELLNGLTAKVFVDKVVSVKIISSNCHVYNLQTENGYYFVNSIIPQNSSKVNGNFVIAKNCRCGMYSIVKGRVLYNPDTDANYQKWLEAKQQSKEQKTNVKWEYVEKQDTEPSEVRKSFELNGVKYNPVTRRKTELSIDEIVKNIGGGDETKGSCASLGFCYIGNRSGLDVLDFRGGRSLFLFSRIGNIKGIANLPNVKSTIINGSNDFKTVTELLKKVEPDKEYFLSIGQHAAIIRKIKDESNKYIYQYLELQSPKNNGYFRLTNDILKNRFGCKKSHSFYGQKIELPGILIDSESLYNNSEFEKILGYLNTKSDMQQKGAHGKIK